MATARDGNLLLLTEMPKPTITRPRGAAADAALSIALTRDLRISS